MKKIAGCVVFVALLGLAVSFIGSNSVSARPAEPSKELGCFVRISADGDYALDAACAGHAVTKLDDDDRVILYNYQDHGQTSWHPRNAFHDTYELCLNFGAPTGVLCGTVNETVTPSGEYKSSFNLY